MNWKCHYETKFSYFIYNNVTSLLLVSDHGHTKKFPSKSQIYCVQLSVCAVTKAAK